MADIIQIPSKETAPSPEMSKRDAAAILKDAKELSKTLTNLYEDTIVSKHRLDPSFIEESIMFSLTDIEGYTDDELLNLYDKYYRGSEESKLTEIPDIREALKDAKTVANDIWQTNREYEDLQKTYGDALVEEFSRKNSRENREKMMTKIEEMKQEAAVTDIDPKQKKEIDRKISIMESMMSMDFILKRISTITDRERTRVIDQFFSEKQGSYCIEKCKSKSPKFGFSEDWYKFFFNLEENFLPEEYHPYNNLFLYGVMRFIGYCDPYSQEDRVFVSSIVNSLIGMIYHKFPDSAMEEHVVHLIEAYDDYFVDYKDKFLADNTTRPGHPVREEAHAKREAERVKDLVASMIKFNIPVPDDDDMSADDLQRYFNQKMEEMVKENSKEKEKIGDTEVSDEDGVLTIKPGKKEESEEDEDATIVDEVETGEQNDEEASSDKVVDFAEKKYQKGIIADNGHYYYYNNDGKHGSAEGIMYKLFVEIDKPYEESGNDYERYQTRFMLHVDDPEVRTDLFEPVDSYTEEEIEKIRDEAVFNIWYFLRFCVMENPIRTVEDIAYIYSFTQNANVMHKTINVRNNNLLLPYILEWVILFNDRRSTYYNVYDGINVVANSSSIATSFINSVYELEEVITPLLKTDTEKIGILPIVNKPSLTNAAEMPGRYMNVFIGFDRNSWIDSIFQNDEENPVQLMYEPLFVSSRFIIETDNASESLAPTFNSVMDPNTNPRLCKWDNKYFFRTFDRFFYLYSEKFSFVYVEDVAYEELTEEQEELVKKIQDKFDTEGGIPVDKFISGEVGLDSYGMDNTAFGTNFDE